MIWSYVSKLEGISFLRDLSGVSCALLDGVFTRDEDAGVLFHPASPPKRDELDEIVKRVEKRVMAWLRRRGYLDERSIDECSNEPPTQTALDACAAIAMGRGQVATLPNREAPEAAADHELAPDKSAVAVDRGGFNLHAGTCIEAGDDMGRERLARYGARPPLSLERLRRLPGGRVGYRLKYVTRGRGRFRIMTGLEFMARLSAVIAPPRYPLVRYAGVLGPRSAWRKDIVPKPRDRQPACDGAVVDPTGGDTSGPRGKPKKDGSSKREDFAPHPDRPSDTAGPPQHTGNGAAMMKVVPDVVARPRKAPKTRRSAPPVGRRAR